jgi:hypothetical protein
LETFGVKSNNLDCDPKKAFYQKGKIYLFAYGIPYFFCESEVNVELRGAFNGKEGDFYPRVGTGVPDDWVQEINTPIAQDNTYHYNKSYSKQSKENFFSHYPEDYDPCEEHNPSLTVYSDHNNWLLYRPISNFEFPKEWGVPTAVDAVTNGALLARFPQRSALYNAHLTLQASTGQPLSLGNSSLFKASLPLEFTAGSQHKLFIPVTATKYNPEGYVFVDSLRGEVYFMAGNSPQPLSTPEVSKFLQQHLPLEGDNTFKGKGITGVYDPQFHRLLLTKLDGKESFTLSYSFEQDPQGRTVGWTSLHSYLPLYYVEDPRHIYSSEGQGLWQHGTDITLYNHFYGKAAPYILEYPFQFTAQDQILQSVKDSSQVFHYTPDGSYVETDNIYFTQAILHNTQESSGILNLVPAPRNSLRAKTMYPIYNADSKDILVTKSDGNYQFNQFWNLLTSGKPVWKPSATNLSVYKDLNQAAMNYSKRSHNKGPIRGKDLKIRLISTHTDHRIISRFLFTITQPSYK